MTKQVYVQLGQPQGSYYDSSCKENHGVVVTNQIPAKLFKSTAVIAAINFRRLKEVSEKDAKAYWEKNKIDPKSFTCIAVPSTMIPVKKEEVKKPTGRKR